MNTTSTTPELTKKQKAVQAQQRYRLKLKEGGIVEKSKQDIDSFKEKQRIYMKAYRASKKPVATATVDTNIKLDKIEKPAEVEVKPVNIEVVKKPVIKSQIVPKWKKSIEEEPEELTNQEIKKARSYSPEVVEKMINKMKLIFKLLDITPSNNLLRVLKSVLLGNDARGDIKFVKAEMPFIQEKNILVFANKIKKQYPKPSSFYSMLVPFVNILSRLEGYNKEYQILTKIAKNATDEYVKIRDNNEITEDEAKRLIDFNPEAINKKLDGIDNINDKFLFALYTLLTPRRLEFVNVRIMKEDNEYIKEQKMNILIIDKANPNKTRFIFYNYKTASSFGKQIVENLPDKFIKILNEYIENNDLKEWDYLFKNSNKKGHITEGTFGDRLTNLFSRIYKSNITNRFIRMSFASYKDTLRLSNNNIKKIADEMGHSVAVHNQYIKRFIT
jgi:hypothetical protein